MTRLYWTCQIAGWSAVFGGLAAGAVAAGAVPEPVAEVALSALGSVGIAIAATHGIRTAAVRLGWLERPALALRLAAAVASATLASEAATAALGAILETAFGPSAAAPAAPGVPGTLQLSGAVVTGLLYTTWAVVWVGAATRSRLAEAERERLALRASLAEARLAAVERRLNPHLLFNALNAVRALVREDPEEARRAVTLVSDLLRATLTATGPTHPVRDEMALVRAGLGIEALRFADRLDARVCVAEGALGARVPVFLVQTLAENAVTHGIARRKAGGTVAVSVSVTGGDVVVRVENSAADVGAAPAGGTGTGLASTRERLALLYGSAASFTFTVDDDRAVAVARFPDRR